MATPVRCSHLALICLASLHLLACATTADATTLPPHGPVLPLGPDEPEPTTPTPTGRPGPASSDRLAASPSASTFSGVLQQRILDACFIACEDNATAPPAPASTATAAATTPPSPRPRVCCAVHTREAAAVDGILQKDGASASGTTAPPSKLAAALKALPLLTIPFLPPPVAALVALCSLASPVSARSDDCFKLNHATCTIYPYDNGTNSIDRTRPSRDLDLGAVCLHPLCHADSTERLFSMLNAQRHGREGDILHIYCIVTTLEGDLSILPWRNTWRVHLPVADPGAAAASGGNICYLELAHLDYREGYHIHCPAGEHHQTYCTEYPEEAIAAAVWEHRRLNYRATAGPRYAMYQQKYKHDEL